MTTSHGISVPADEAGQRSSTDLGRAVVATALAAADPVGASAAERETAWRSGYLLHFRRLVEAGLVDRKAWLEIAGTGLAEAHRRMVTVDADPAADPAADPDGGAELPVDSLLTRPATGGLRTVEVRGRSDAVTELAVPLRGEMLRGDALRAQLDTWALDGVLEPSAVEALHEVMAHPQWLSLPGTVVAVLGAGAEMGPLGTLLRWGATVAAVDLPRPALWERVLKEARQGAGTLLVPVSGSRVPPGADDDAALARVAGADLLAEVPAVADWLLPVEGRLAVGNYLYADGATHVRVSMAADVLAQRLHLTRPDLALAFLATPTDTFVVPRDAVRYSVASYEGRSARARLIGRPVRWASRGALMQRAYPPDADPGLSDALVPAQGPNYALAKRLQRWRASVAREAGQTVSFHVAPSSRTRSVIKNRALAAAFAGAHRFGVEIFDPSTANVLMAAQLVRDLNVAPPKHDHPWQDEAYGAVHGGLWRTAYAPRSVLGIAALLGYATSRG